MLFKFTDRQLQDLRVIHDRYGSRAIYAMALGRDFRDTRDLDTLEVEDFSIAFYTAYNSVFGITY